MIQFFKVQQFGHWFESCIFKSSGTTELLEDNNDVTSAPEMLAYNSINPDIWSSLNGSYKIFLFFLKKNEYFILSQAVFNAEATVG